MYSPVPGLKTKQNTNSTRTDWRKDSLAKAQRKTKFTWQEAQCESTVWCGCQNKANGISSCLLCTASRWGLIIFALLCPALAALNTEELIQSRYQFRGALLGWCGKAEKRLNKRAAFTLDNCRTLKVRKTRCVLRVLKRRQHQAWILTARAIIQLFGKHVM